jgi:hypothetical protein
MRGGILTYLFLLIGIGLLGGAGYIFFNTSEFVSGARKAQGTVVGLKSGAPEVRFQAQDGREIRFTSSVSSKPPAYSVGENVEVLYRPDRPEDAEVNAFMSLWLGVIILGALGSMFSLTAAGLIFGWGRKAADPGLKLTGMSIQTDFQGVERDTSYSEGGRHPFHVVTQWQNPATGEIHLFHSGPLWYDPTSHMKTRKITVYIERGNPEKYFMDLSFLPRLAGGG